MTRLEDIKKRTTGGWMILHKGDIPWLIESLEDALRLIQDLAATSYERPDTLVAYSNAAKQCLARIEGEK